MKNFIGTLFIIAAVALGVFLGYQFIYSSYQYNNEVKSYWDIADKTSTISQKSDYIDKFVDALKASHLEGTNDALFLKTPNTSFNQNFQALLSLQDRLHQIKTMDETSLAYQTAIQQITAQEQGQADDMLGTFHGCWMKVHYYWLWNPILGLIYFLAPIILIIFGVAIIGLEF